MKAHKTTVVKAFSIFKERKIPQTQIHLHSYKKAISNGIIFCSELILIIKTRKPIILFSF